MESHPLPGSTGAATTTGTARPPSPLPCPNVPRQPDLDCPDPALNGTPLLVLLILEKEAARLLAGRLGLLGHGR